MRPARPAAKRRAMAEQDKAARAPIGSLAMIWGAARRYPGRLAGAATALLISSAATLAIPSGFRLVIDRGFAGGGADIGRWFEYLFLIVVILALSTAARFYFVSWLGERVVADIRSATQANLLRQAPRFFEENRPSEIASRMTADTAIIDQVVGSTVSIALRNAVTGVGGLIYLLRWRPSWRACCCWAFRSSWSRSSSWGDGCVACRAPARTGWPPSAA